MVLERGSDKNPERRSDERRARLLAVWGKISGPYPNVCLWLEGDMDDGAPERPVLNGNQTFARESQPVARL
jgi:hypothetical protein